MLIIEDNVEDTSFSKFVRVLRQFQDFISNLSKLRNFKIDSKNHKDGFNSISNSVIICYNIAISKLQYPILLQTKIRERKKFILILFSRKGQGNNRKNRAFVSKLSSRSDFPKRKAKNKILGGIYRSSEEVDSNGITSRQR